MTTTAVDTSVAVAALLSWHEAHERALSALEESVGPGRRLVLPAPALLEAYSVMTRLPAPHRLAPGRASEILVGSFESRAKLVALEGAETWSLVRSLASAGIGGGPVYDAQILACAVKAGARRLLTLDERDFSRLDPQGLEIVVP